MSARWLVTGANGFLGWNVGTVLGGRVSLLGATRTGATPEGFDEGLRLDLSDASSIGRLIAEARPDVVLNTAAVADHETCSSEPALAKAVNADAVGALAEAAAAAGARLVHISTDAVFDGARGGYRESDEPAPFSVYGETKLLGEQLALEDPSALVVRTNFFGWSPSGSRSILEFFVNSLSAGRAVLGYSDFVVSSIYARHLIEAIIDLVDRRATGIVHVASSDAMSKYEFGCAVAREFGLDESLITPTSAAAGTHGTSRVRNLSLDCSAARLLLDRSMPTQGEGIRQARLDRLA